MFRGVGLWDSWALGCRGVGFHIFGGVRVESGSVAVLQRCRGLIRWAWDVPPLY